MSSAEDHIEIREAAGLEEDCGQIGHNPGRACGNLGTSDGLARQTSPRLRCRWYLVRNALPGRAQRRTRRERVPAGRCPDTVGARMRWDYDFGDGWEHAVVVEGIGSPDTSIEYPVCLAGRRACPPEDCGGPLGYEDLLAALADPGHPDHEDFKEWAPPDFDPDFFDIEEANLAMRSPRPLAGW